MVNPFQLLRGVVALAVLERLSHGRRRRPPLRPGAFPPAGVTVSAVVPARDEAGRLGPCLEGLLADADLLEVIVVDDRSSDGTGALAASMGATVVVGEELPPGWAGKAWALEQGLRAARGDVVVFLDADTRAVPGLGAALARVLLDDGLDALSVLPAYDAPAAALHAALTTTIPLRSGPGDALGWTPRRRVLNGQGIAVPRERFLASGGWAQVRGFTTEDVALAQRLERIAFVDASALVTVRPYEDFGTTLRGWSRSLMGSDVHGLPTQLGDVVTLWVAQGLPLVRLALRRGDRLDVLLLAVRLGLHGALAGSYRPRRRTFWLAPLLDPFVCARLTWAVLRPDRTWRGRTYARAAGTAPRSRT